MQRSFLHILFLWALVMGSAQAQTESDRPNTPGFQVEESNSQITIRQSGRLVLTYNKESPAVPDGMNPLYARSGFLHPVASPSQKIVTAAFPIDHAHQHGIFTAWVQTQWNGRNIDFWNLAGGTGRVLHERLVRTFSDGRGAGFEVDLLHRAVQEPVTDILRERWHVTVLPTDGSYHAFELESTQQAITDEPLVIKEYHYGGVAFRGLVEWLTTKDSFAKEVSAKLQSKNQTLAPCSIINELGSDRIKGNHEHVNWVALNGEMDGNPVTVSVLSHRDNFRSPQAVRLHPSKPYFVFSPCVDGQFVIDRQHAYHARYRYLITDAYPSSDWINEQWDAWHRSDGQPEKPLMAYVGTFSSPLKDVLPTQVDLPPGNGRGIHVFQVDRKSGAMTRSGIFEMGTSPSCLAVNAAGDRIYSANETDRVGENKHGTISAFSVDPINGSLKLLNTVASGGAGPTYVSLHPSGKFLLVANYFGGSIAVLPIDSAGRLGEASDVKNDQGNIGPTKSKNAPPGSFAFSGHDRTHAHMIQSDPSGQWVIHCDLGLDQIFVWRIDLSNGSLHPTEHHIVSLPPGDGPRHFHFHPNGKWFYSIQEEGSTIVLFEFDSNLGRMTQRQTISTLPPGFRGSNFCSEILVSQDGKFVYAGNRLHDSIGIFAINENGLLKHVGDEWTRGNYPRSFSFSPDGRFLYCCNQRADNIAVFQVDKEKGSLNFTGQYVPVGNPSIVLFNDLARR